MSHTSLVPGKTDGVAVPAGYVGEFQEVVTASDTGTSAADTWTDATGLSMTLQPGVWLIGYNVMLSNVSASANPMINAALRTGSSLVGNTICAAFAGTSSSWASTLTQSTVINISSATTYKVSIRSQSATASSCYLFASSVTGGLTNPDNHSKIWAVRIA